MLVATLLPVTTLFRSLRLILQEAVDLATLAEEYHGKLIWHIRNNLWIAQWFLTCWSLTRLSKFACGSGIGGFRSGLSKSRPKKPERAAKSSSRAPADNLLTTRAGRHGAPIAA